MTVVALGEMVDFVGGGTPSKDESLFWGGDIPWVSVKDLKSKVINETIDTITPQGVEGSSTRVIEKGALIIATRMAVGKAVILGVDAAINQDLKAVRIKGELDRDYLFYFLKQAAPYFERVSTGATVKGIKLEHLRNLEIPLPPLEEQKRIAGILDEADRVRKKTQALIDKYDELAQSLFLDMFGDPVTNPKGWEVKPLEMLAKVVRGSSPRPAGDPRYFNGSVPRLMVSDLTRDGMFVRAMTDSLTVEGAAKSRPMKKGQLVMAVSGNPGLPAILAEDCCIHDGFAGFRDLSSDFDPRFLYFHFRLVQKATASQADGAIFQNITTNTIRNLSIPVVPMQLQQKFINEVGLINDQKELVQSGFELQLFNALLQKAFKGELT